MCVICVFMTPHRHVYAQHGYSIHVYIYAYMHTIYTNHSHNNFVSIEQKANRHSSLHQQRINIATINRSHYSER